MEIKKQALFLFFFSILFLVEILNSQALTLNHLNLYYENDALADHDRYYTFGIKFAALFQSNAEESGLYKLPFINNNKATRYAAFSIGQQTFTPADKKTTEVVEDDRPYAGWLWAGFSLFQVWDNQSDILELELGVVGPSALGEEIMTWFHRVMGYDQPQGWHNQLNDELGLILAYNHNWKIELKETDSGFEMDLIPNTGFTLGNVHTGINAGTRFRLGWNVPNDFGVTLIKPASESNIPSRYKNAERSEKNWRAYLYLFFEGRWVLRNIFLDGNTFSQSHSVEKNMLVAEAGAGIRLQYKNMGFTTSFQIRSKEFRLQPVAHEFWSLMLYVNLQ